MIKRYTTDTELDGKNSRLMIRALVDENYPFA
jgi:hypothetical protein